MDEEVEVEGVEEKEVEADNEGEVEADEEVEADKKVEIRPSSFRFAADPLLALPHYR